MANTISYCILMISYDLKYDEEKLYRLLLWHLVKALQIGPYIYIYIYIYIIDISENLQTNLVKFTIVW